MSRSPTDCIHLTVKIVREIHSEAIGRFGGLGGVRELSLLESAVAAPQATFGGESLFTDLIDVAAAYLFYICRNHAFLDGNKRVALGSCLVFLRLNAMEPPRDSREWEDLTLAVAAGELDRDGTTARLRKMLKSGG